MLQRNILRLIQSELSPNFSHSEEGHNHLPSPPHTLAQKQSRADSTSPSQGLGVAYIVTKRGPFSVRSITPRSPKCYRTDTVPGNTGPARPRSVLQACRLQAGRSRLLARPIFVSRRGLS